MLQMNRNFVLTGNGSAAGPRLVGNISARESRVLGTTAARPMRATANDFSGGASPGFGMSQTSTTRNTVQLMLEGLLAEDPRIRRKVYRDIYYHDAIAGGAVDLHSTIPFSDFHLTGVRDKDQLEIFHKCLESLHLKSLLPSLSRDYLTLGNFIGTASFDAKEKIFSSIMPQNIDAVKITEIPIFGANPLFDLTLPKELMTLMKNANKDPRVKALLKSVPDYMQDKIKEGIIPLEPANTLFLARRTLTSDTIGTSYFERILPIHLLEKALFRGTIDQAYRRQRSTLHVMVGGDDEWVPTQEDLQAHRDMFLQADMDPTGAILVTRTGVATNEIRAGQDFWKIEDIYEFASALKFRALGISDAMIQGDASLNTLDASLSIMIDGLRDYRSMIEREVFYDKLFPSLSAANDFRHNGRSHQIMGHSGKGGFDIYPRGARSSIVEGTDGSFLYAVCGDTRHTLNIKDQNIDMTDLVIPRIVWHKHLSPEGDTAYLEMLEVLQQRGLPIPMSMMAAAGGLNLNNILDSVDEEISIRKRVVDFMKKIEPFVQEQQQLMQSMLPAEQQQEATASAMVDVMAKLASRASIKKPVGLLNRQYPETAFAHNTHQDTGKYRTGTTQEKNRRSELIAKRLSSVLSERAKVDNAKIKRGVKDRAKTMSHGIYGKI